MKCFAENVDNKGADWTERQTSLSDWLFLGLSCDVLAKGPDDNNHKRTWHCSNVLWSWLLLN